MPYSSWTYLCSDSFMHSTHISAGRLDSATEEHQGVLHQLYGPAITGQACSKSQMQPVLLQVRRWGM